MLQSIAAWFLRSYLGEYVENLNTEYLSVGYGGIELGHLRLKKSAIDKLNLPIQLVSGVIGQLHLVIPYANPNTQPWIIKIKQLHIILRADSKIPSPPTAQEIEQIKKQKLHKLEEEWKANMEKEVKKGWLGSWMPSFYSSLSSSIVDNLVLEIEDVHIRYQFENTFSFGITISSLCSKSPSKDKVSSENDIKVKILELKDLSLYFDKSKHIENVEDMTHLKSGQNILGPVCATAQIQRNVSKVPLDSSDGARFSIDVTFSSITLAMSKLQWQMIFNTYESISRYYRSLNYHSNRPKVTLKNNARIWWKFAIEAVIKPIKLKQKKSTRQYVLQRVKDINTYVSSYMKYLTNTTAVDEESKAAFEVIEERMEFEELVILRRVTFAKVVADKNAKKRAAVVAQNSQQSWGEWAMGFYWNDPSSTKDIPLTNEELSMTKEEKEFLDSLTEGMDSEGESILKKDSIFAKFHFLLETGSFILKEEQGDFIFNVTFDAVNLTTEARPKSKSFEWIASLGNMEIKNTGKLKDVHPRIVAPQMNKINKESSDFLQIKFLQKESQLQKVFSLFVLLQPSTIVYQQSFIKKVMDFFKVPAPTKYNIHSTGMTQRLQESLHSHFEDLKRATQNEFSAALTSLTKTQSQENRWNIHLDIAAPNFLVPVDANVCSSENLGVISFGRILFVNQHGRLPSLKEETDADDAIDDDDNDEFLTPSSTPPEDDREIQIDTTLSEDVIRERFYDSYTLELTKLQVLTCSLKENWMDLQLKGYGPGHIIEEFSVSLSLKRRTLFTADPEFPALILTGVLPQLFIHVDQQKLNIINSSLEKFSFEEGSKPATAAPNSRPAIESLIPDDVANSSKNFQQLMLESKLFHAKFCFEKLSLALHSRGRCFAELQVNGIECELSQQPYNLLGTFIISSIQLVDAIQTFGPDYELLVSSTSEKPCSNNEVLMHVTYEKLNSNHPKLVESKEHPILQVISINMNLLRINGNLETIVELNNIIKQLGESSTNNPSPYRSRLSRLSESYAEENQMESSSSNGCIRVSGCFNEVSILVFRTHFQDSQKLPLKVAKITAKHFEVAATIGNEKAISGSIGSILLEDLSPGCLFYPNILSIGVGSDVSSPIKNEDEDVIKAFRFSFSDSPQSKDKAMSKTLHLNMASLFYFHNPSFLFELTQCAGDYKTHAYNVARSIQTAAKDMAKSMVLSKFNKSEKLEADSDGESLLYSIYIETPVLVFPQNPCDSSVIIGRLGKITVSNDILKLPDEANKKLVKRIAVDIDNINLSLTTLDIGEKTFYIDLKQLLEMSEGSQTSIIHNIDIKLIVDKSFLTNYKATTELNGCINSPLKFFLSVPIYNTILTTLSFATSIKKEKLSAKSPPLTPSASSSQITITTSESSWEIPEDSASEEFDHHIDTAEQQKISASFHIPSVEIELHGELHGETHGFVIVLFHDFHIKYNNLTDPYSTFNISLQSFSIEDLLHKHKDKYRYLVSSLQESGQASFINRTCSSCPDDNDFFGNQGLSKSLPNLWFDHFKKDRSISMESFGSSEILDEISESCPLINIDIVIAKIPDNSEGQEEVKKSIMVNMNSIDFVMNLQTWVILLEFFGIGAPATTETSQSNELTEQDQTMKDTESEVVEDTSSDTELQISMRSVAIYLSKEEYPLARANVHAMNLHVLLSNGNQDISGSIGNISLSDLSPHAGFYQQRLVSVGDKAIDFSFFRFGKPDPEMNRDLDMELALSMAAIQYVHTQRFLMETIAFCQHFILLQEVLGRIRAASAGNQVSAVFNRAARLLLKVNADAPILFLPHKATSRNCVVCNLGKLVVKNDFIYSDDPKTNGYSFSASRYRSNIGCSDEGESKVKCRRLLDCINIKLTDMHIMSALKIDDGKKLGGNIAYEEQGNKMMSESFALEIDFERNLEWMFGRQVPDMSISGVLSSIFVNVDLSQYSLIMGILGENFGEAMDAFEAPSSVLVDPLIVDTSNTQVWTGMRIKLNLLNVSMVVSPTFSFGALSSSPCNFKKLARFDFENSTLIYESFTDGSKSIDLVSSDVVVYDVRKEAEVAVLLPHLKNKANKEYLQFEVHYLDTMSKSFLTFLCNQSRIILLFDFFINVWSFISRKEEQQYKEMQSPSKNINQSMDFEPVHSPSIVTKASQTRQAPEKKKTFELKVNITESELVMVEDIEVPDTQTVIMKLTAVLSYRPDEIVLKPVNCSIQNLEIFSCLLDQTDNSALSILDPVAFLVELKMPRASMRSDSSGLQDAIKIKPVLETQFQSALSIRVSYHDVQMLMRIINNAKSAISNAGKANLLSKNSGNILDASFNASHANLSRESSSSMPTTPQSSATISGFEVKGSMISVVLIDDSGNNDVPLMEMRFTDLLFNHSFDVEWKGLAKCHIDANYYNTRVSAWEPFLESWKFNVIWHSIADKHHKEKAMIKLDAPDRLDMNVTSSFISIAQQTVQSWSANFLQETPTQEKTRAPFLPFVLRNQTGSKLTFYTAQRSPTRSMRAAPESVINDILDIRHDVDSGKEISFTFEKRTKNRHQGSHQLIVHQIVAQVCDWQRMTPLTVDRVGQFFRIAHPNNDQKEGNDDVFVIFDISVEGARKVITVKSAFSVNNFLHVPVEVMAQLRDKHYALKVLNLQENYSVPLKMIRAQLYVRPLKSNVTYKYSDEHVNWQHVVSTEEKGFMMTCKPTVTSQTEFRFYSLISCMCLPKASMENNVLLAQPEHIVSFQNHVMLENSLPVEVFYFIRGSLTKELIKPGQQIPIFLPNAMHQSVEIGFSFENFPAYDLVKIELDGENVTLPARVYDTRNRVLILSVLVTFRSGTVNISIFSPFWLINKSGLPLIFKREEESEEVSGQFEEHEEARSLTPLLFSFITSENPYQCLMRVGNRFRRDDTLKPLWSKPFAFDKEVEYRTLYVKQYNNQLERSYDISIVTSWGKGAFSKTRVVALVPHYQLENLTGHTLLVVQRYLLKDGLSVGEKHLATCYPDTVSFFHWYRADFDKIACVRILDDDVSIWSGGMKIDSETSYYVNVKSRNRKTPETFLRAHISYNSGTFRCTFSDASQFPPPFRILNNSEVSLFYWQELGGESQMNSFIKAKESKDYVLDEPILPARLTMSVYNESSETYDLCVSSRNWSKLYYQNGIYIGFTHTFSGSSTCNKHLSDENSDHQFVLDVQNGKTVVLARKQQHKLSQLWRMNLEGNLVHFGTSSMKSSRKTTFSHPKCMVLDVEERLENGVRNYYLILQEKSSQRENTQTWFFESHMLHCCIPGFVVHCPSQFKEGSPVKMGAKPSPDEITSFFYSCVSRQNMRPGSGVLSVRTYSHGPTHVIEVTDSQQEQSVESWIMLNETESSMDSSLLSNSKCRLTEVVVSLAGGLGISFINFKPEELFFATLSQIQCTTEFTSSQYTFGLEIGSIQIDNQLFGGELPVVLYALPPTKKTNTKPANLIVSLRAEKDEDFDLLVFKEFSIDVCKLVLEVDDRLVLKLVQTFQHIFQSWNESDKKDSVSDATNIFDSHRIDNKRTNLKNKIFFEHFYLNQGEVRLSLIATGKIDGELLKIKKSFGIPLVSFESAAISFDQFHRSNILETKGAMISILVTFYKDTLIKQAAVLLGSLDILGNPMGLIQDFSTGVEGLVHKGNIGGLLVNVAHGFSDSAAKMTGVIADNLWSASMDNKFQESRDSWRVSRTGSSSSHISAGLKGFGMGVIGGLTSMITQPIDGAAKKGVSGFISGIGKGVVGTIAKPVAGVLDFASGTAAAVRTKTETQLPTPNPVRLKRNCYGPGGILGRFHRQASEGQEILLKFNESDLKEMFVSMEVVRPSSDRLKAILTNKGIYFVKSGPPLAENIKLHVEYSRLMDAQYYGEDNNHFIEMFLCRRQQDHSIQEHPDNRTTVRCETKRVACKVAQKTNYLKNLYEETLFAVPKTI